MYEDNLDCFKQLHEQPEKLFKILYSNKNVVNEVLPFYVALLAKTSSNPEKFMQYTMDSLEKIYGSDKTGKTPKELEISEYAYKFRMKVGHIFSQLDDY
jgi:hypothetical protein